MGSDVEVRELSKAFGATVALEQVSVAFRAGEIHAVVGENGSGKSTLFKILAGVYEPDSGDVLVGDTPIHLPIRPSDLSALGFAFVHQDLGIAGSMSVLDNARIGLYEVGTAGRISWKRERSQLQAQLRDVGLDVSADTPAGELPQAEQTLLAIARALGRQQGGATGTLLVLDEPTAYLPGPDRERLYAAMRRLAASGLAIAFSTHHMDEARNLGDCITVLRDGRVSAHFESKDVDEASLIRALLGRDMGSYFPEAPSTVSRQVVLEVDGVTDELVADVSFSIREGEILGLTGLVGMGHDRVPYLLYGRDPMRAGTVTIGSRTYDRLDPRTCLNQGIGLLPANRQRDSGVLGATLRENVTIPYVHRFVSGARLRGRAERRHVRQLLTEYGVRPRPDPDLLLSELSGGNQQKALLAKWLSTPGLHLLMLHEPTQGVDIGAKKEIFTTITAAARRGLAVLLVTAEYDELAHLADRVIVMRRGRMVRELHGDDVTEERITHYCHVAGTTVG